MTELVLLKYEKGSQTVTVLCPTCGRISQQKLSASYNPSVYVRLENYHTCPICNTTYWNCSTNQAKYWSHALLKYNQNQLSYNLTVKDNYIRNKRNRSVENSSFHDLNSFPEKNQPAEKDPIILESGQSILENVTDRVKSLGRESMSDDHSTVYSSVSNPVSEKNNSLDIEQNKMQSDNFSKSNSADISTEALDRKIERWKHELLDTGKRNKMINYRETARATLTILEPNAKELFNQLSFSDKSLTFQKPINKDTDLRTYSIIALMETLSYNLNVQVGDIKTAGTIIEREKTLKNLRSKAKLAQEEQGTNILYLCFGFIYWREQNKDSSPLFKAPLLLMPVSIGLKSLNAPYTLSRYDDEIEVNPTLDYLFRTEYNIELPEFDNKNKDSFDEYFAKIEEIVDKRGWKLTREVSLGLLSFLKISMYHDLNNNRELIMKNKVLRAIAGDRTALEDIPAAAEQFNFDAEQPNEWHEVIDADSSQEEAILLSKLGASFVMEGPPGTGKSQTITNIIAEALADGKKVLFVSEKAAALEVVLKRLTEVHLDDFCLSLHNYKANKKEIIDSIGANLSLEKEYTDQTILNELTELFHDREFLTKYANDLHRVIQPLGESVYMAFGKLSKLEKASFIAFRFEDPKSVTREQYSSLLYVLNALEKALHNLEGTLDSNVWHGTTAKSSGQTFKQQLLRETNALSEKLYDIDKQVTKINGDYLTAIGNTWTAINQNIVDINIALDLPFFPYQWTDPSYREMLLNRIHKEAEVHHSLSESMKNHMDSFRTSVLDAPLTEWLNRTKEIIASYKDVGYNEELTNSNFLTAACHNTEKIEWLYSDLEIFSVQYKAIAEKLGLNRIDSFRNAKQANVVFEYLKGRSVFRENNWFNSEENEAALELADEARNHAMRLSQARKALYSVWNESVCSVDLVNKNINLLWHNVESSISEGTADQLTEYLGNAQKTLDKITSLVNAQERANRLLCIESSDTAEGLHFTAVLLKQVSEAPYLETVWFDMRKNTEERSLIDEACARSKKVQDLSNAILKKWEPEALYMEDEAIAMLGRFKTEHIGLFHRMKSGYKEDLKKIRLLSKEVGKSVDEAEAISFLQSLKEIQDEKRWYVDNQDLLKEISGSSYRGANTDWNAIKTGMEAAVKIAANFQFYNIPINVISAIQKCTSSIQVIAEIKELSAILSEENITDCCKQLETASYILFTETTSSFSEYVIPEIRKFQKTCHQQLQLISILQSHHRSSSGITVQEVRDLLENENQIRAEEDWFSENSALLRKLFGSRNNGPESNFDDIKRGLFFAKDVLDYFSGSVPEEMVLIFCSDEDVDTLINSNDKLTLQNIDILSEGIRHFTSFAFDENLSVSEYTIPRISKWLGITKQLMNLDSDIRPYLVSDEITIEKAFSSIPAVIQSVNLRKQILSQETNLAQKLGNRYKGMDTDWESIESDITKVSDYLKSRGNDVTPEFIEMICSNEELRADAANALKNLKSACDDAAEPYNAFLRYFDDSENICEATLLAIADRYDKCINGFNELNKWLDYVESRAECDAKGLGSFTEAIALKNNTVSDVRDAFERGFHMQWLSAVIDDVSAVQSFRKRVHEQRSERFIQLDQKQYEIAKKRIRERIINTFPNKYSMMKSEEDLQLRILKHEMEKKRQIMPLRKLFKSIPDLLLKLKPCLMMSPLSVAYFLDANIYKFDMVIFDEASQIFPQDAIGAIFRANQVIIAGDTKQLPPTNFFSASTNNGSEGYDDDEGYDEEVYDSILEETTNILPNRTLLWHYRSKHEHLIAFSNQEFYRNELVTFPSSNEGEPDTGVEFVYVEDGYYEPSPRNYNILEAKRIVELVKEHIERHPDRSLGIIAFSEKQQQAISLEIQRFRERYSEYEDFFAEGRENEFFVKNLENVQGDERDTIFFSIGYAKTKDQKEKGKPMSMRFGPLMVSGGERRLNVAITRAKINVKLVSSILPSDIDLSKTESVGIRMLRSYIEFAMNGESTLAASHRIGRPDDFVDSIAQFLRNKGFEIQQYVGCSGYKIDIAVKHPSDAIQQFVAGVECDGYSYVSAKTARDRDRLRSSVLKSMGWNLYRVWSSEWHKNPEVEGQNLISFLQKAIIDCDEKIKDIELQKQQEEEARRIELEKARAAREAEERRKQRELEAREAKLRSEREEAARKREAVRKQAEEDRRRTEESRRKQIDLSWVKPGVRVYHKYLGEGVISSVNRNEVKVNFGRSERILSYPSAFVNGTLIKSASTAPDTPEEQKAPDWAIAGASVTHNTFGDGIILSIDGDLMSVRFGKDVKQFSYPGAFTAGHLKKKEAVQKKSKGEIQDETKKDSSGHEQLSSTVSNGKAFVSYLRNRGIDESMSNNVFSIISKFGDYAINKGFTKIPVFEIENAETFRIIMDQIENDVDFINQDRNRKRILSEVMRLYLEFLSSDKKIETVKTVSKVPVKQGVSLPDALNKAGFKCIDNRNSSNILWVLYDQEKEKEFIKIITAYNVHFKFEKRGALATNNAPAWRIMFN